MEEEREFGAVKFRTPDERSEEWIMARTTTGFPDDMGKWLTLASALIALGVLPRGWQKAVSAAGAALVVISLLD